MVSWMDHLRADPTPWVFTEAAPAVRHLALCQLADRAENAEVAAARDEAMASDPIAAILAAQDPEGWWAVPGSGYLPKYTATTWQINFLEQMGADGADPRVRAGCEYVLGHAQTASGSFGVRLKGADVPPPSGAVHCLNGNLLRALVGLGWLDDERVQRAADWHATVINGKDGLRYYSYIPGPGVLCGANAGQPCAWGAVKALLALARIPSERQSPDIERAIASVTAFLLSRDPLVADYPTPVPGARPSGSWFKLGFPSGYVTDVLQTLEALVAAGVAGDPRLDHAAEWLIERQRPDGAWTNDYAYAGKMIVNVDRQGQPSGWVTLRACRVLKALIEAR